jgi:two-component system, chemotaxis family, protein-glutamate methylesterase/glutaminase
MANRDIVVIGGSAGSIEAASEIVRELPEDFPAALFVVVHFPGNVTSTLPKILARAGVLPASHARDGEAIEPGRVYVARPNCHLVLEHGRVRLTSGPKENGSRPAIDPLFRSAAHHYGRRVVGVVLSGNLNDGTAGLMAIKRRGGIAVVQSLDSALYPGMPGSAMDHVAVDHVAAPDEIATFLDTMVRRTVPEREVTLVSPDRDETAGSLADDLIGLEDRRQQPGIPSTMSCPECHGVLWEVGDGELVKFRCRVGHAYTDEALLAHQADQLEAALWTALRALEEHAALSRRLSTRASGRGHARSAAVFTEHAVDAEHHASLIRTVLARGQEAEVAEMREPESSSA